MNLTIILFLIGILGFVLNRKNIILMLISIEIMLLAITFLILVSTLNIDDIIGQTYAIYIIVVAGAESAIGLGILVAFYRFFVSLIPFCLSCGNKTYSLPWVYVPRNINTGRKRVVRSYFRAATPSQVRNYSATDYSKNYLPSISPGFISGLFDAEGSFVVTILKNATYKTGWNVQARIQIKMHEQDRALIQSIQDFFGGIGYVSKPNNRDMVEFRVSTLNDTINVIIPHFDKYPLITKKSSDYLLFKQIALLMLNKEHNNIVGLQKIVSIRASLNLGLPLKLKEAFPDITPASPEISNNLSKAKYNNLLSPEWVVGFITGESNFFITIQKSKTKSGLGVWLRFSIAQHSRDLLLLESFVDFFGCGYVAKYEKRAICEFIITKLDHIVEYIIPFLEKYPVVGSKHLSYLDFKRVAYILQKKEHLNIDGGASSGLEEILRIKSRISLINIDKATNNHKDGSGKE